MDINVTNNLFTDGVLRAMYKAGFVNNKIFDYRDIYLWVCEQVASRGISKTDAVREAVEKFKKDERTIWRALNSFTG